MRMKSLAVAAVAVTLALISTYACTTRKGELGTDANPVRFYFMPLKGDAAFNAAAPVIEKFLKERTGLTVKAENSKDFISIIKALGNKKADVAFLNTLGYVLAHDWTKAEAVLKYLYGDVYSSYKGEVLARVEGDVSAVTDLNGKTMAFADPYSAGGYIYAMKLIKDKGVTLGKIVFADGHKDAVEMLYEGKVDAAAAYHTQPSADGLMRDARTEVAKEHPDVISKIKIVALTDEIPNGPVTVRNDLPPEIKQKLAAALKDFARTPDGRRTLFELYNMTGFTAARDSDYDGVRTALKDLGKNVQEVVAGGISFYKTYIEPGLE